MLLDPKDIWHQLAPPPPDAPKEDLGRRLVVVAEPLVAFLFMGGWGDGPYISGPGALFRLAFRQGDQIFFSGGAPSATGGILGHFHVRDLSKTRDCIEPFE